MFGYVVELLGHAIYLHFILYALLKYSLQIAVPVFIPKGIHTGCYIFTEYTTLDIYLCLSV